jgi:hypothetical protein
LGGPFAANQLVIFSGELKLEMVQVWFSIAAMIAPDFKRMRFGNVACVPWMALNLIRRSPRHIDSPSVGLRLGSVRSEACIGECDSSGVPPGAFGMVGEPLSGGLADAEVLLFSSVNRIVTVAFALIGSPFRRTGVYLHCRTAS